METVILDNNLEYFIMETIIIDEKEYTLFQNINDETDFCFRKTIIKDGEKYFTGLDDRKEFDKILLEFTKKLNS